MQRAKVKIQNVNCKLEIAKGINGDVGFTLLEVLVALSIIAIAIVLILQLYSSNLRAVSISGDTSAAAVRGDSRMREILAEASLAETSWREITEDGYGIEVSIAEVLKERTDNLSIKMMEVNLTVRWREGMKERSLYLRAQKLVDKIAPAEQSSPV
jgi:type II secretion system protein I